MGKLKIKLNETKLNPDLENTANMHAFKAFESIANHSYTIVVASPLDKVAPVLKDYMDSGTAVISWNAEVTYIPLLTRTDTHDISEDLTASGFDFCVYTQKFEIA